MSDQALPGSAGPIHRLSSASPPVGIDDAHRQHQPGDWHASLQAVKNAAYAWRQAIYYLSLCDLDAQLHALADLTERVQAANGDLPARFGPAVDGLALVLTGGRFGPAGMAPQPGQGRRFLGWSTGPHWALRAASMPIRA